MIATKRCIGMALVLALMPAMANAQQHDMGKMGKDTTKKAPAAAMQHDMAGMKMDSGMKHQMGGMKMDTAAMHKKMAGMMGMMGGWGELHAFHALLMATWHPAQKDSLGTARALAPALVTVADAWSKSKGPAACDNATTRKALPTIVTDTRAYADAVAKKGSDAAVKAALLKVHDAFEKSVMPCMMASMMGSMKGMKD